MNSVNPIDIKVNFLEAFMPIELREQILFEVDNPQALSLVCKQLKNEIETSSIFNSKTQTVYDNILNKRYVKQTFNLSIVNNLIPQHGQANGMPLNFPVPLYFRGSAQNPHVIYGFYAGQAERYQAFEMQQDPSGQSILVKIDKQGETIKDEVEIEFPQLHNPNIFIRKPVEQADGTRSWERIERIRPTSDIGFEHDVSKTTLAENPAAGQPNNHIVKYVAGRDPLNQRESPTKGFASLKGIDVCLKDGRLYLVKANQQHHSFKQIHNGQDFFANVIRELALPTLGIKAIGLSNDGEKLFVMGVNEFSVYDFGSPQATTHRKETLLHRMRCITFYLKEMAKAIATNIRENGKFMLKLNAILSGTTGALFGTWSSIEVITAATTMTVASAMGLTALIIASIAVGVFAFGLALNLFQLTIIGMIEGRRQASHRLNDPHFTVAD